MGEIRFVGTGETRGYPYLVCKKVFYVTQRDTSGVYFSRDQPSLNGKERCWKKPWATRDVLNLCDERRDL